MDTGTTALATTAATSDLARVGALDPTTAWLYLVTNRISLKNVPMGFDFKYNGEFATEFVARVVTFRPLNSHPQPDASNPADNGKPSHKANVQWCESYDGKKTNAQGDSCDGCPAISDCRPKLEMTLQLPDEVQQAMLTLPEVSYYRYKEAAQALAQIYHLHFSQVVWKFGAAPRETMLGKQKITHVIVVFTPMNPETGEIYVIENGSGEHRATAAPPPRAPAAPPRPAPAAAKTPLSAESVVAAIRVAVEKQTATISDIPKYMASLRAKLKTVCQGDEDVVEDVVGIVFPESEGSLDKLTSKQLQALFVSFQVARKGDKWAPTAETVAKVSTILTLAKVEAEGAGDWSPEDEEEEQEEEAF